LIFPREAINPIVLAMHGEQKQKLQNKEKIVRLEKPPAIATR